MMTQRKIRISTIAEAKDFVARASECDFDINIFYNRVIIDAKSILGASTAYSSFFASSAFLCLFL